MTRVALNLYLDPTQVEGFVLLQGSDGSVHRVVGIIDTGAEVSLFPKTLLSVIDYEILDDTRIKIEQAGIAAQVFEAQEATINLQFEDRQGNISPVLSAKVWFGETSESIIGVRDILDRATLYIDFRQTRSGWIEFDEEVKT